MLPFDKSEYLAINKARLDHLASLGLDLNNKSVIELGSGIGQLTGFFEERSCRICSVEGRLENVTENLKRYPWRVESSHHDGTGVYQADLTQSVVLSRLPLSDIVFCYGFLYHTAVPSRILAALAGKCRELLLLETCVYHEDDGAVHPVQEDRAESDQSLDGVGCRPSRDWLFFKLQEHFKYVYLTRTQPDHEDFPLKWPAKEGRNSRAVFVASKKRLTLATLTTKLLRRQRRYEQ